MLPYLLHVFHYRLEIALLELLEYVLRVVWLYVNLLHEVFKDLVAIYVEECLQQLVFVVEVVYLYEERCYLWYFVNHIEVLLGLDGIQNSLCFLTQFGHLLEQSCGGYLSTTLDEAYDLDLWKRLLLEILAERHLLLLFKIEKLLIAQKTKSLAIHNEQSRSHGHGYLLDKTSYTCLLGKAIFMVCTSRVGIDSRILKLLDINIQFVDIYCWLLIILVRVILIIHHSATIWLLSMSTLLPFASALVCQPLYIFCNFLYSFLHGLLVLIL